MARQGDIVITEESVKNAIDRLARLSPKALRNVNKATMRRAGNMLKSETVKGVKRTIRNANAPSKRFPNMTPPAKGVRVDTGKYGTWSKVSIFNRNSFLLAIFEKGTGPRYTKGKRFAFAKTKRRYGAGLYRGAIKAGKFFAQAVQTTNPRIEELIKKETIKAVNRQWNKERG